MPYPPSGPPSTNIPDDESAPGVPAGTDAELIIRSPSLQRVMKLAEKVARHPAAVLIVGETGIRQGDDCAHHPQPFSALQPASD